MRRGGRRDVAEGGERSWSSKSEGTCNPSLLESVRGLREEEGPVSTPHSALIQNLAPSLVVAAPSSRLDQPTHHGPHCCSPLGPPAQLPVQPPAVAPRPSVNSRRRASSSLASSGYLGSRRLATHPSPPARPSIQAPQSIAVQLTFKPLATKDTPPPQPVSLCLGWTGLPAQPAPVNLSSHRGASQSADRIEIDPQFAAMLHPGLQEGTTASPPAASCGVARVLTSFRTRHRSRSNSCATSLTQPRSTSPRSRPMTGKSSCVLLLAPAATSTVLTSVRTPHARVRAGDQRRVCRDVPPQPGPRVHTGHDGRMLGRVHPRPLRRRSVLAPSLSVPLPCACS